MQTIKIENLTKYYNKHCAVDSLSLSVNAGEIFGFIGQNGAGKSTTIRCMLNLIFPTKGEIQILGMDAIKQSKQIKNELAYIPSEVEYYSNIKVIDLFKFSQQLSGRYNEGEVDNLCEYFELDLNKQINQLSLGNRKKVSIIQALLSNPKIIILDEPTSGLDPVMQDKLFTQLLKLKANGCTIFLSSHNLTEVQKYCDRVAIIKGGKLIEVCNINKFNSQNALKVTYTNTNNEVVVIEWDRDVNELLNYLLKKSIKTVEIVPVTIEDTFKKYYYDEV